MLTSASTSFAAFYLFVLWVGRGCLHIIFFLILFFLITVFCSPHRTIFLCTKVILIRLPIRDTNSRSTIPLCTNFASKLFKMDLIGLYFYRFKQCSYCWGDVRYLPLYLLFSPTKIIGYTFWIFSLPQQRFGLYCLFFD